MRRQGYTLIEVLICISIIGILVAMAVAAYQNYSIRQKCEVGHEEPTGATICYGGETYQKCKPETNFVCDKWKAESGQ